MEESALVKRIEDLLQNPEKASSGALDKFYDLLDNPELDLREKQVIFLVKGDRRSLIREGMYIGSYASSHGINASYSDLLNLFDKGYVTKIL